MSRKKTAPITTGATIAPIIIPHLNHRLFNGVKSFDFIIPKTKKIKDITTNQIFISPAFIIGQNPKIKNTMKKTKPKFLFEPIFILDLSDIMLIYNNYFAMCLQKQFFMFYNFD